MRGCMTHQNNEFGRRVLIRRGPGAGNGPSQGAIANSSLLKQIGGVAVGVALAFAVGAGFVHMMKQAGRTLDQKFVERATPGSPEGAIKSVKNADTNL